MSEKSSNIDPRATVHVLAKVSPHAVIDEFASVGSYAVLGHHVRVGRHVGVAANSVLAEGVFVGDESMVGERAVIQGPSYIGTRVLVGQGVMIGDGAFILDGAKICPNKVRSVSSNGRCLEEDVSIGRGVLLHDEVELGERAIVPTQRTIASLGNLGSKNRVITIYGSDTGPRYSIGCQVGVSYPSIKNNIEKSEFTTTESAGTYTPYLPVMNEIGAIVQKAYDSEAKLIDEILAERVAAGMGFDR